MRKRTRCAPPRPLQTEVADLANGSAAPLAAAVSSDTECIRAAVPTNIVGRRFEIGSVTKVLTGTLLGVMVEAGEIDPQAPVDEAMGECLPWGGRVPTLEELATHRSGLPNTPRALWWREVRAALGWSNSDPWAGVDTAAYRDLFARASRGARAGGRARYSSMGVGLLGDALARAAGIDLDQLLATRVLAPLGMSDTGFDRPQTGPRTVLRGMNRRGETVPYLRDQMPAAGMLASTVDDLTQLLRATLGEGPADVVAGTQRARRPVARFGGLQVGYCWLIADSERGQVAFHSGGTWGSQAHVAVAPDRGRTVVLLSATHRDLDTLGGRLINVETFGTN